MRAAALLAGAAGSALAPAMPAHALEPGDIAWGCEDAGYAAPLEGDGPPFRELVLLVHTDWGVLPAALELPKGQTYTGSAPACVDLDGDGAAEIAAAIAGPEGAWLTVYGKRTGPIASTAPVPGGLSLVGGVDLDGDGASELAWLEEAAGRLRVAAVGDGALVEIATADGFAYQRPDGTPAGAVCQEPSDALILPRADWSGLVRVRLADGNLVSEQVADGTDQDAQALAAFLDCPGAQKTEIQ